LKNLQDWRKTVANSIYCGKVKNIWLFRKKLLTGLEIDDIIRNNKKLVNAVMTEMNLSLQRSEKSVSKIRKKIIELKNL
jgi:hypothetical protein